MKLNLLWNQKPMTGYINIDPFGYNQLDKLVYQLDNLHEVVCDSEAKEIIAEDVIDFIPKPEVQKHLEHWVSKLRHGGEIVIGGVDLISLSKSISNFTIDIATANDIIHGSHTDLSARRNCSFSLYDMSSVLEQMGLKIILKRNVGYNPNVQYNNFHYIVKARRI